MSNKKAEKFSNERRNQLRRGNRVSAGEAIMRETYSGRKEYYTGRGQLRRDRWSRDFSKAKLYDDTQKLEDAINQALMWSGRHSELVIVTVELRVNTIVKRQPKSADV